MIVALGVKSQNALLKPLRELGIPVLAAGDANAPGRIMEATLDAVNLAYDLWSDICGLMRGSHLL